MHTSAVTVQPHRDLTPVTMASNVLAHLTAGYLINLDQSPPSVAQARAWVCLCGALAEGAGRVAQEQACEVAQTIKAVGAIAQALRVPSVDRLATALSLWVRSGGGHWNELLQAAEACGRPVGRAQLSTLGWTRRTVLEAIPSRLDVIPEHHDGGGVRVTVYRAVIVERDLSRPDFTGRLFWRAPVTFPGRGGAFEDGAIRASAAGWRLVNVD